MSNPTLVSLTFDDGLRCQFEKALPVLKRYLIPATFFLIANREPTHDRCFGHTNDWWKINWCDDDIAMLKELLRGGHEIGGHTVTHDQNKMRREPDFEATECKRLIEDWLGTNVSSFAYPYYRSHSYLANPVKNAGYEQARGGGTLFEYRPHASYYDISRKEKLDRYNVDCREISTSENVSEWAKPGHWHVLTFHGIGGSRDGWMPVTVEKFAMDIAELARRRDSGDVQVVTFKDGAARFR